MSNQSNDLKALANNCVKYLLILDKKKIPIKKLDLIKNVCPSEKESFKKILQQASLDLERVFGIQLLEVPGNNEYILISNLPLDSSSVLETPSSIHCAWGILLPVLALIFMNGVKTKEALVWKFLKKLGLTPEIKIPTLHNPVTLKELLTQIWVRQQYLKHIKKVLNENVESFYDWGFRAHAEVDKMQLLKWVCQVYGDDCEPKTWKKQYQEALN